MPTTDPFTFLGCGTGWGMQAQSASIDITGTDYYGQTIVKWTTFSGVSDDSPTTSPELIEESRLLAMQYVWNLHSVPITVASSPIDISERSGEKTMNKWWDINESPYEEEDGIYEPKDRGCVDARLYTNPPYEYIQNGIGSKFYEQKPASGGGNQTRIDFAFSPYIQKMYNGSTRDEDNFLGWGATENNSQDVFNSNLGAYGNHLDVDAFSYFPTVNGYIVASGALSFSGTNSDSWPRSGGGANWYYEKAQVNGMWFIAWNYVTKWDNASYTNVSEYTREVDGVDVDYETTRVETNILTSNSVDATSFDSSIGRRKTKTTVPSDPDNPDYDETTSAAASGSIGSFNYYTY